MNLSYLSKPFAGFDLGDSWRTIFGTAGPDNLVPNFSQAPALHPGDTRGFTFFAGAGADNVSGSFLNDVMWGGTENDRLFGQGGDDELHGEQGIDLLDGGPGADVMSGGPDSDDYFVDNSGDRVIEAVNEGVDYVTSSIFFFQLPANVENLNLIGSAVQGYGNGGHNDIIGNDLDNVIDGGDGQDELHGGFGQDTIAGGPGNDMIIGGPGRDLLYGGPGNDMFQYGSYSFPFVSETGVNASTWDVIGDFRQHLDLRNPANTELDLIDLRDLDSNGFMPGDPAFVFIGQLGYAGFTAPGQVGYTRDAFTQNFYIQWNTDSDRDAEGVIEVQFTGQPNPTADWFLL